MRNINRKITRMRRSVRGYTRALRRAQGAGLGLLLLLGLCTVAHAQGGVSPFFPDACALAQTQSIPISVTSATTTSLIAPVALQRISICGFYLASVGGTSKLEYGTGATCGTGTTALTGAFAAATTVNTLSPLNRTQLFVPVNNRLCILSGTSTSATAGFLVFVQQ